MEKLQDRFQFLLDSKGLTSYQLSKKTGVSNATLSRIANKGTKPNSKTLETLCKYFNVSEDWFLTGNEIENKIDVVQKNENEHSEVINEADPITDAIADKLLASKRFVDGICKTDSFMATVLSIVRGSKLSDDQYEKEILERLQKVDEDKK